MRYLFLREQSCVLPCIKSTTYSNNVKTQCQVASTCGVDLLNICRTRKATEAVGETSHQNVLQAPTKFNVYYYPWMPEFLALIFRGKN